jgi:hypothetical protein
MARSGGVFTDVYRGLKENGGLLLMGAFLATVDYNVREAVKCNSYCIIQTKFDNLVETFVGGRSNVVYGACCGRPLVKEAVHQSVCETHKSAMITFNLNQHRPQDDAVQ